MAWLKEQKAGGKKIVLCTAANERVAIAVSEHLNLFDDVIASDASINLKSVKKRCWMILVFFLRLETELLLALDIIRKLDITVVFGGIHFRAGQGELGMMTYNEKKSFYI